MTGPSALSFDVVDVFAERPFTGNPLAVVHGADGLSTGQLQALAREFNLSETVFPLPARDPGADYRARIFTPVGELPFAGHPSVGVAWVLARHGLIRRGDVVQECGAGLLRVRVGATGARVWGGEPSLGAELDAVALARIVGLAAADLDVQAGVAADTRVADTGVAADIGVAGSGAAGREMAGSGVAGREEAGPVTGGAARVVGAGVEWAFLAVRADAVGRAAVPAASELLERSGRTGMVLVAFDAGSRRAHVRMFAPGVGVPEDPATGSAAVALGVWLVARGLLPGHGTTEITIDQGAEIGRPSTLELVVRAEGGRAVESSVGGRVVPVSSGTIVVPA
ncbi:MAG: PhzF family phenazine biosynthesis protein [Pseudonocardia sp.]